MKNVPHQGNVAFVNHEKKYIIIEYAEDGKKKTINGSTGFKKGNASGEKKPHHFHIGDTVSFEITNSAKGSRNEAVNIRYLYNTALDLLINKSRTANDFTGFLKIVDGKYFVKELDSYLFFPVTISPWQIAPGGKDLNEAVSFSLEQPEKREGIKAKLHDNKYIPEFYAAVKAFKSKTPLEATVYKISPHGIYLNLIGDKIRSKVLPQSIPDHHLKAGDKVSVLITYLSPSKIITEPVM